MPRGLFCFAALCLTIALLVSACTRSLPPLPSTELSPEQATQTALAYRSDLAALAATAAYKPGATPAEEVPATQLSSPTSLPGTGSTPGTGSEPEASSTPGAGNYARSYEHRAKRERTAYRDSRGDSYPSCACAYLAGSDHPGASSGSSECGLQPGEVCQRRGYPR